LKGIIWKFFFNLYSINPQFSKIFSPWGCREPAANLALSAAKRRCSNLSGKRSGWRRPIDRSDPAIQAIASNQDRSIDRWIFFRLRLSLASLGCYYYFHCCCCRRRQVGVTEIKKQQQNQRGELKGKKKRYDTGATLLGRRHQSISVSFRFDRMLHLCRTRWGLVARLIKSSWNRI